MATGQHPRPLRRGRSVRRRGRWRLRRRVLPAGRGRRRRCTRRWPTSSRRRRHPVPDRHRCWSGCRRRRPRFPNWQQYVPLIEERYRKLAEETITVQRVHGDLHLGQVLRTPETLAADRLRRRARAAARGAQAAGLAAARCGRRAAVLRIRGIPAAVSRDATMTATASSAARAREWVERNTASFCDGYAAASGADPRDPAPSGAPTNWTRRCTRRATNPGTGPAGCRSRCGRSHGSSADSSCRCNGGGMRPHYCLHDHSTDRLHAEEHHRYGCGPDRALRPGHRARVVWRTEVHDATRPRASCRWCPTARS